MSKTEIEFLTFCIGLVAVKLNITDKDAHNLLKKYDLINDYIVPCFDSLHTQGESWLTEDIISALRERGADV